MGRSGRTSGSAGYCGHAPGGEGESAREYRRLAKAGLNPRYNATREIPTFEEVARQVHLDRLPTWKNIKHGAQWISTLETYAFPVIGRLPVSDVGQPEVLACLSPIWTAKPETARRVAQRIRTVLDVARSRGARSGENRSHRNSRRKVLPKVAAKPRHHAAMDWRRCRVLRRPARTDRDCRQGADVHLPDRLPHGRGARGDVAGVRFRSALDRPGVPDEGGERPRATTAMLEILKPLKALGSEVVFEAEAAPAAFQHGDADAPPADEGRGRDGPRLQEHVSGLGRRGRESPARGCGDEPCPQGRIKCCQRAYARSDLLDRRRTLMERWSQYVTSTMGEVVSLVIGSHAS